MPEVMFVLKAFVVALVITVFMQMKIGNSSIETHAHLWMETSTVPTYIHEVSSGAVLAIRNAAKVTSDFVAKSFSHDPSSQRSGRMTMDFKRSSKYEEERPRKRTQDE